MRKEIKLAAGALCLALAAATVPGPVNAGSWSKTFSARDLGTGLTGTGRPHVTIRSLSGGEVEIGERVRFEISSNRGGYGHIYVVSASGRTQLWMENVPVRAGSPMRYPSAGVTIRASAPEGHDKILLLVTKTRIDGFNGRATTRLPEDLSLDDDGLRDALETMMADYPRSDWTWADTSVEVVSQ